jgi:hypothetical protein
MADADRVRPHLPADGYTAAVSASWYVRADGRLRQAGMALVGIRRGPR